MRNMTAVCVPLLLSLCVAVAAQEAAAPDEDLNVSAERTLGLGMQLDFPFGGLLSGRYWFASDLAGELIVFLWGDAGDVEGVITGRVLVRIADRPTTDFYGAVGASVPVSSYGSDAMILSAAGGIEFGFRAAPSLAWNLEFGVAYATDGELGMVFGTGIHFYF